MIYLLHFTEPLGDPTRPRMSAAHYLGWAADGALEDRLAEHLSGRGAKITRAAHARGIALIVARTWDGDRNEERRLKKTGHFADRLCVLCNPRLVELVDTPPSSSGAVRREGSSPSVGTPST